METANPWGELSHNKSQQEEHLVSSSSEKAPAKKRTMMNKNHFPIEDLPRELQDRVLGCLFFDEISACRLVSKAFDVSCSKLLNKGFYQVEKDHARILQQVKAQLPRRESERRNHPLSRHSDILTALETRLSLLNMTFTKFMDVELCCFIPGKVLDEMHGVLRGVRRSLGTKEEPQRPHELLTELRDISSMAMEYFDEHIAPRFKEKSAKQHSSIYHAFGISTPLSVPSFHDLLDHAFPTPALPPPPRPTTSSASSTSQSVRQSNSNLVAAVSKLQKQSSEQGKVLAVYKKELSALKATATRSSKKLVDQAKVIAEQNRKLEEFARKYDVMIGELRSEVASRNPEASAPSDDQGSKEEAQEPKTETVQGMGMAQVPDKGSKPMPGIGKSGERKRKREAGGGKGGDSGDVPNFSPKNLRPRHK